MRVKDVTGINSGIPAAARRLDLDSPDGHSMILLGVPGILLLLFGIVGGLLALLNRRKRAAILRWTRILCLASAILIVFGFTPHLLARLIVNSGTRPKDRILKDTPVEYQAPCADIDFETQDHLRLSAW
jgi:hypothetical protein